jgi:hypothetical protein
MIRPACAVIAVSAVAVVAAAEGPAVRDVRGWMVRVGARVEEYYARAQSIMCEETVRLEPLGPDLLSNGDHVRELVYELRVAWDAPTTAGADGKPPEATVLRQLLTVDGRPPRPGDEPGCFDRKPVSTEPLGMLLPHRQQDYIFSWKGQGRESGRASVTLEYKASRKQEPVEVVRKGDCSEISLPGRSRGRLWLDPATADVLRLDEDLTGQFDVRLPAVPGRRASAATITIERASSSISYRAVTFHDPEETLTLPSSIVSVQVIRNSGMPRLRTYQKFSKYRRFITDARILQ